MSKRKLHPCWWCGSDNLTLVIDDAYRWQVLCLTCGHCGPGAPTEIGAKRIYNRGYVAKRETMESTRIDHVIRRQANGH